MKHAVGFRRQSSPKLGISECTTSLQKPCDVWQLAFARSAVPSLSHGPLSFWESQQKLGQLLYEQEKYCIASQVDGNCKTSEKSYPRRLLQIPFPISTCIKRQFSLLMWVYARVSTRIRSITQISICINSLLRLQVSNAMDKSNLTYQGEHVLPAATCSLLSDCAGPS